jgi:hypothetical protein
MWNDLELLDKPLDDAPRGGFGTNKAIYSVLMAHDGDSVWKLEGKKDEFRWAGNFQTQ